MSDLLVAAEAAAQSLAMGDHIKHTPAPIPTVSAPDESESDSSSDDSDSDSDSDESSGDMASQDDGGTGKDRAEQLEGVVNALCAEDDEPIQVGTGLNSLLVSVDRMSLQWFREPLERRTSWWSHRSPWMTTTSCIQLAPQSR